MSQTVDSKVVEMSFDNKQFEQGVQSSMSTLDKLKQALKLDGITSGLDKINGAASKVDMGALGAGIQEVHNKFSALEVMGITALSNITNSAVNAGKKVVESFTTEPISDGFKEYELKMGSVQTIMAGSGASVEEVNEYLNKLNEYSDKTIYSFKDMTSSIGKFTNAGVELGTAVKAIQGISNEAARSGANAQEASRAMYNFSQALSTGSVKLIDWKSIENANMATKEFKQELINTAVAMGTVIKTEDGYQSTTTDLQGKVSDVFDAVKDFNGSLSAQWMTSEVVTEALSHYSNDVRDMTATEREAYEQHLKGLGYSPEEIAKIEELAAASMDAAQEVKTFSMMMDSLKEAAGSGWATTFELLFGNLEEAKVLWTSINSVLSDFIDGMSDSRNSVLSAWKIFGGRDMLIKGLSNAFKGLMSVIKPIGDAMKEVFPPMTGHSLTKLTASFTKFTQKMKLSETSMENLKNTFKGIFSIVKLVTDVVGGLISRALGPAQTATGGLLDAILAITGNIGNVISGTISWAEESGILAGVLDTIAGVVTTAFTAIKNAAVTAFGVFNTYVLPILIQVGQVIGTNVVAGFNTFKTTVLPILSQVGQAILGAFGTVKDFLAENITLPDFSQFKSAGDVFGYIGDTFENLKSKLPSIEEIGNRIKDTFKNIFGGDDAAKGVDESNGPLGKMSSITDTLNNVVGGEPATLKEKAKNAVTAFADGVKEGFSKISFEDVVKGAKFGAVAYLVVQLLGIVTNIRKIASGAAKVTKEFAKFPKNINKSLNSFTGVMKSMQNDIRANILLKVAAAIFLLTVSIVALTMVDQQKLANVAVALFLVIGIVTILAAVIGGIMNKGGGEEKTNPVVEMLDGFLTGIGNAAKRAMSIVSKAAAFTLIAAAVAILVGVFLKLAGSQITIQGAIQAVLIMMVVAKLLAKLTEDLNASSRNLDIGTAASFIAVALAIGKLANVLVMLSGLSWGELAHGLVGVGALMLLFGVLARMLNGQDITKATVGIGILAIALMLLVPVVMTFGSLADVALKGVGVVALLSLVMAGLAALAGVIGKTFGASVFIGVGAMLLLVVTINLLAPALMLLGAAAPVAEKALLIIAGALAILLVAGAVAGIGIVTAGLITLCAVMLSFGASMLMAGAGVLAFATGLQILLGVAAVVIAAVTAIFLGVKGAAENIDFAALGSTIINGIINIGKFIIDTIAALAPVIWEKIQSFIAQLPSWMMNELPTIIAAIVTTFVHIWATLWNLILAIAAAIPGILKGLVTGFVNGIMTAAGPIGNSLKLMGATVIDGVLNWLATQIEKIPGIGKGISDKVRGLKEKFDEEFNVDEIKENAKAKAEAVGEGIDEAAPEVQNTAAEASSETKEALEKELQDSGGVGKEYIHGVAKSIEEGKPEVTEAAEGTTEDAMTAMMEGMNSGDFDMSKLTDQLGGQFGEGMDSAIGSYDFSGAIGGLTEGVDTSSFDLLGTNSGEGYINGLEGMIPSMGSTSASGGTSALEGLANAIGAHSPATKFAELGKNSVDGYTQGFKNRSSTIKTTIRQIMTQVLSSIRSTLPQFKNLGANLSTNFASGIRNKICDAKNAADSLGSSAANALDDSNPYKTAKGVGEDIGQGVIDGIKSKYKDITSAGYTAGKKGAEATKDGAKTCCPSRITIGVGKDIGDGLIVGMDKMKKSVGKSGEELGKNAAESVRTPLEHIQAILNGEGSFDPTIKPVLDLSDVEQGAGKINSIFGANSLGLSFAAAGAMRVNSASRMTNADVVSAIDRLNDRIDNMEHVTNNYTVGSVSYDDGTNVSNAVRSLVRAAKIERRT